MRPKRRRQQLRISRQICNYPLARDVRTRQRWRQSERTQRWLCRLPDDRRIEFRLPPDIPKALRRCPTAFDFNVLALILAQVRAREREVKFPSAVAMLGDLGMSISTRTRHQLVDALQYWAALSIRYRDCWHHRVGQAPITKTVPPPFTSVVKNGHRMRVVVRKEWIDLRKRYFCSVDLPLPMQAAAQNLVLAVATSIKEWGKPKERRVWSLCRKIGLTHSTYVTQFWRMLNDSGSVLNKYYASHGKVLEVQRRKGKKVMLEVKAVPVSERRVQLVHKPRVRILTGKSTVATKFKVKRRSTERKAELERIKRQRREMAELAQQIQERRLGLSS